MQTLGWAFPEALFTQNLWRDQREIAYRDRLKGCVSTSVSYNFNAILSIYMTMAERQRVSRVGVWIVSYLCFASEADTCKKSGRDRRKSWSLRGQMLYEREH